MSMEIVPRGQVPFRPEPSAPGPRQDRRAAFRHPALVRFAWLGWRDGAEFRRAPARLVDVSTGGCLVVTNEAPPEAGTVLVRLHGPLLPIWFEAKVLEVLPGPQGLLIIRLVFPGSCPYDLYMAVAYGTASIEASGQQPELPEFFREEAAATAVTQRSPLKWARR